MSFFKTTRHMKKTTWTTIVNISTNFCLMFLLKNWELTLSLKEVKNIEEWKKVRRFMSKHLFLQAVLKVFFTLCSDFLMQISFTFKEKNISKKPLPTKFESFLISIYELRQACYLVDISCYLFDLYLS